MRILSHLLLMMMLTFSAEALAHTHHTLISSITELGGEGEPPPPTPADPTGETHGEGPPLVRFV